VPRRRAADRTRTVELATKAVAAGRPLDWFEQLYGEAGELEDVPWADLEPNKVLVREPAVQDGAGRRALVVGCGYGDDAEWLAAHLDVERPRDMFATDGDFIRNPPMPDLSSPVVADLLDLPEQWRSSYDLIVEIYTLQVLPHDDLRERAFAALRDALARGGLLFIHCRLRDLEEPTGDFPWPLTEDEVRSGFAGLDLERYDAYIDDSGDQPVQRLIALARRH